MRTIGRATIGVLAACAPAHAFAAPEGSGNFGISLNIPVVCGVGVEDAVVSEDSPVASGEVREFCNSSQGFQVVASHRPLDAGEKVELTYGLQTVSLGGSGLSPVAFRSGARNATVPFSIQADGLASGLAVSFSVIAI